MTTQVLFKTDSKYKKLAQVRARREGLTLSDVLNNSIRAYGTGELSFKTEPVLIPNKKTARLLRKIDRDIASGKERLSPVFTNTDEMFAYMDAARKKSKKK